MAYGGLERWLRSACTWARFTGRCKTLLIRPSSFQPQWSASSVSSRFWICRLSLPRNPTAGRILIDGIDLRDVTITSLAGAIGMVTQETYLFHDTIRTNLLYAKPDATQDEIEAAARAANIHNFIAELSEGYDTIVGERG